MNNSREKISQLFTSVTIASGVLWHPKLPHPIAALLAQEQLEYQVGGGPRNSDQDGEFATTGSHANSRVQQLGCFRSWCVSNDRTMPQLSAHVLSPRCRARSPGGQLGASAADALQANAQDARIMITSGGGSEFDNLVRNIFVLCHLVLRKANISCNN